MTTEKALTKAERNGFLPVESRHHGLSYVVDQRAREVMVVAEREDGRYPTIIPIAAIAELAEIAKIYC